MDGEKKDSIPFLSGFVADRLAWPPRIGRAGPSLQKVRAERRNRGTTRPLNAILAAYGAVAVALALKFMKCKLAA